MEIKQGMHRVVNIIKKHPRESVAFGGGVVATTMAAVGAEVYMRTLNETPRPVVIPQPYDEGRLPNQFFVYSNDVTIELVGGNLRVTPKIAAPGCEVTGRHIDSIVISSGKTFEVSSFGGGSLLVDCISTSGKKEVDSRNSDFQLTTVVEGNETTVHSKVDAAVCGAEGTNLVVDSQDFGFANYTSKIDGSTLFVSFDNTLSSKDSITGRCGIPGKLEEEFYNSPIKRGQVNESKTTLAGLKPVTFSAKGREPSLNQFKPYAGLQTDHVMFGQNPEFHYGQGQHRSFPLDVCLGYEAIVTFGLQSGSNKVSVDVEGVKSNTMLFFDADKVTVRKQTCGHEFRK